MDHLYFTRTKYTFIQLKLFEDQKLTNNKDTRDMPTIF